jgi:signal transduction histidine kinase
MLISRSLRRRLSNSSLLSFSIVWAASLLVYRGIYLTSYPTLPEWARLYGALFSATTHLGLWVVGYVLAAEFEFDGRVSAAHIATGVLLTIVLFPLVRFAQYAILKPVGYFPVYTAPWSVAFIYTPVVTMLYGAALAAGHAIYYRDELERRDEAALQMRRELASTQANALQAQLQPHFLFNALNSISGLIGVAPERAELALEHLKALLRVYSGTIEEAEIPLRRELELLQLYLNVQRMRYGDRIRFVIHAESSLLDRKVPTLLLQPLVENSIQHGAGAVRGEHYVCVLIMTAAESVKFIVRDDGPGLPAVYNDGVGVGNTRRRLESLYGDRQSFNLRTMPSAGTEVVVEVPGE